MSARKVKIEQLKIYTNLLIRKVKYVQKEKQTDIQTESCVKF
jgi:hypothetical protein